MPLALHTCDQPEVYHSSLANFYKQTLFALQQIIFVCMKEINVPHNVLFASTHL